MRPQTEAGPISVYFHLKSPNSFSEQAIKLRVVWFKLLSDAVYEVTCLLGTEQGKELTLSLVASLQQDEEGAYFFGNIDELVSELKKRVNHQQLEAALFEHLADKSNIRVIFRPKD